MKPLAVMMFLLVLGGDEVERALVDYRAGRFEEAHRVISAVVARRGDRASPELLYDQALCALAVGRYREAEVAMETAAARGGGPFVALRDFVFGNVAFAQCLTAAELAGRVEAGPVAFDAAISSARRAADHWRRAAISRHPWPAAIRNAERALAKLAELQEAKEEAARKRRERKKPKPPRRKKPKEPDPPKPDPDEPPELRVAKAALEELAPEQVKQLVEKLLEKERAKIEMRRRARREGRRAVERDW